MKWTTPASGFEFPPNEQVLHWFDAKALVRKTKNKQWRSIDPLNKVPMNDHI